MILFQPRRRLTPANLPPRLSLWSGAGLCALLLLAPPAGLAATRLVNSVDALQDAIDAAAPGDTVILKNGAYSTDEAITVNVSGGPGQPITIAAESVGGVEIAGTEGFDIAAPAAYVVVSGFKLTGSAGGNAIGVDTSHVRFTRNVFSCQGEGPYLSVIGDDAEVDHNEFRDKKAAGSMIAVGGTGSQVARRLWIHHNYFHDFSNAGSSDAAMIRFGLAALSASTGAGLVEHNLFVRCRGVSEMVSNRSSGNTYRYNTFLDSPTSQFTLRHGNAAVVYGNYFRQTEGLRIFGTRHQVFSNYFDANYIGVTLGNGDAVVADGAPLSVHDRPDRCVIAFNTFVDNRTHYQMSRRPPPALGATNTTFANNVIQGGGSAAKIGGPNTGALWSGNLVWNVSSKGDLPAESLMEADPLLAPDADGIKRPQAGSPVIGAAIGVFPGVTFDLDGQPRPEKKSKGACEPGLAAGAALLLSAGDVGPGAK